MTGSSSGDLGAAKNYILLHCQSSRPRASVFTADYSKFDL